VLAHQELREKYSQTARRTFEESYSAEAMTRRYEAIYLEAVA
jgi:glycosyltransferase involved in cell wall biosynthesis